MLGHFSSRYPYRTNQKEESSISDLQPAKYRLIVFYTDGTENQIEKLTWMGVKVETARAMKRKKFLSAHIVDTVKKPELTTPSKKPHRKEEYETDQNGNITLVRTLYDLKPFSNYRVFLVWNENKFEPQDCLLRAVVSSKEVAEEYRLMIEKENKELSLPLMRARVESTLLNHLYGHTSLTQLYRVGRNAEESRRRNKL